MLRKKRDICNEILLDLKIERMKEEPYGTGISPLDSLLVKGIDGGKLIIIGAHPGMGKTSLALEITSHNAMLIKEILIYSFDMTKHQIIERLISKFSGVDLSIYKHRDLTEKEKDLILSAVMWLESNPIYIEDSLNITTKDIGERISKMENCGLVFIDSLEYLLPDRNVHRDQIKNQVLKELKNICKSTCTSIILSYDLPRTVEEKTQRVRRPYLSDLNEEFAHFADIILFIFREPYYDDDFDQSLDPNLTEIIVAKNTTGYIGTAEVNWDGKKFTDRKDGG